MEVVLPRTECVLDQITCLLCRKIPNDSSSLIYLCTNNHLFCHTCYSGGNFKGKKCRMPACGEQLKKSTDPILQDIYANSFFHCGYSRCSEIILGKDLKSHQGSCHYRPIECPSCRVLIAFENYLQHLDTEHRVGSYNYFCEREDVQDITVSFPCMDTYGTSVTHFHKFHEEVFFTHIMIKSKDIYVWIQYYGDEWKQREFTANISLRNIYGHNTETRVPIVPIHDNFKSVQKSLCYAHFSRESLKCYLLDPNNNHHQLLAQRKESISESTVGLIPLQVLFSWNFLDIFNRNLHFDLHKFGFQSDC